MWGGRGAASGVGRRLQARLRWPRSGVGLSGCQTPAHPQICYPAPSLTGIEPAHISCDQLLVYLVDLGDPRSSWNVGGPHKCVMSE